MAYKIVISDTVRDTLADIKAYITQQYFSEQAGKNTVDNILNGLERLEVFPEAGFDADERVGNLIFPPHKTRGIVLGDYLAFYHILEDQNTVFVTRVLHAKVDYLRVFRKKK